MNGLRLQYHKETGKYPCKSYPDSLHSNWEDSLDIEYTEWLEKYIEDATKQAKELLNHNIFYKKR